MRKLRKWFAVLMICCLALSPIFDAGLLWGGQQALAADEPLNLNKDPGLAAYWDMNEADEQPPTAPADLAAEDITDHSVWMSWKESMDNEGIAFYHVYQAGTADPVKSIP